MAESIIAILFRSSINATYIRPMVERAKAHLALLRGDATRAMGHFNHALAEARRMNVQHQENATIDLMKRLGFAS